MFDNLLDKELARVGYGLSVVAVVAGLFFPGLYLFHLGLILAVTTLVATTKGFE